MPDRLRLRLAVRFARRRRRRRPMAQERAAPPPSKAALLLEPLEPRIMLNGVPGFAPALDYEPPGFDAAALLAGELVETPSVLEAGEDDSSLSSPVFDPDPLLDMAFRTPISRPSSPAGLDAFPDLAAAAPRIRAEAEQAARAAEADAEAEKIADARAAEAFVRTGRAARPAAETAPAEDAAVAPSSGSSDPAAGEKDPGGVSTNTHDDGDPPPCGGDDCRYADDAWLNLSSEPVIGAGDRAGITVEINDYYDPDPIPEFYVDFADAPYIIDRNGSDPGEMTVTEGTYGGAYTTGPITSPGMTIFSASATIKDEGPVGPAADQYGLIPDDIHFGDSPVGGHENDDGLHTNQERTAVIGVSNVRWANGQPANADGGDTHWGVIESNQYPEDPDPTDDIDPAAGKRIFPGKTDPNDPHGDARDEVRVVADLAYVPAQDTPDRVQDDNTGKWVEENDKWTLEGEEITVGFRAFDVDDPSAGDGPVDQKDENTIDGGPTGGDNRGGGGLSPGDRIVRPNADGDGDDSVASTSFEVSMKPGDNFRVAANGEGAGFDRLTKYRDSVLESGSDDYYVPFTGDVEDFDLIPAPDPFGGELTEPLTVWRELHVERDSMGAPPPGEPFNGETPGDQDNGTNIGDDDVNLGDLQAPSIALMQENYRAAYVKATAIAEGPNNLDNQDDVAFFHNLIAADVANQIRDVNSERGFWVVQVVAGYEDEVGEDQDPNDQDGATLGYSPGTDGPSWVYRETIRDVTHDLQPGAVGSQLVVRRTALHESLHRFNMSHGDPGPADDEGIMNVDNVLTGDPEDNELTDAQLAHVRDAYLPD